MAGLCVKNKVLGEISYYSHSLKKYIRGGFTYVGEGRGQKYPKIYSHGL